MFFISDALAQTAAAGASSASGVQSFLVQVGPIILLFVVFWFFLIRPQQKRQKEHLKMVQALNKGDEVMTMGGLTGRIESLDEQYITIAICKVKDEPVTITMQRGAVQSVLPRGTIKSFSR